jgi:hypothetical protein
LSSAEVKSILGADFNTLPIFKNNSASIEDFADFMTQISISNVYPNPAVDHSIVQFRTDGGGKLKLRLFDPLGNLVQEYFDEDFSVGTHEYKLDLRGLKPGNYILQLRSNVKSETQVLQKL